MMLLAGRHRAAGPALACLHAASSSVEWHESAEVLSTSGRLSAMIPSVSDPPHGVMATLSQLCAPDWVMDRGFASSAIAASAAAAQAESTTVPTTPQPGRPSRGARRPQEPYPLQAGHLYEATVTAVRKSLAEMDVMLPSPAGGDPSTVRAILPRALLTQGRVEDMSTVLKVGEQIKVLALGPSLDGGRHIRVSTKFLEPQPGAMLTDKQAVFAGAEKRAEEYRTQGAQIKAERQAFKDNTKVGDVVQARYVLQAGSQHLVVFNGRHLFKVSNRGFESLKPLTKGQVIQLVVTKKKDGGEPRFAASQPTSQASA